MGTSEGNSATLPLQTLKQTILRIIGGTFKGKLITTPKNLPVRPTTDFAKESLFNILNNKIDFESTSVLDLFCGTGNISLEFASRGAQRITSVDKHPACAQFLKTFSKSMGIQTIFPECQDVFKYLKRLNQSFDVIFADPPYELENIKDIHELVFANNSLNKDGWLIIEHGAKTDLSQELYFVEKRKYGNVNFSFFHLPLD